MPLNRSHYFRFYSRNSSNFTIFVYKISGDCTLPVDRNNTLCLQVCKWCIECVPSQKIVGWVPITLTNLGFC